MAVLNVTPLFLLSFFWLSALYFLWRVGRTGKSPKIRKIPALDRLDELVGRAVELGKPVLLSPADGASLRGEYAAETQAGLSVMNFATRICARMGARLMILVGGYADTAEVLPLVVQSTKEAYLAEGKAEQYRPDIVQFVAGEDQIFAAAAAGIIQRERVASTILIGPWQAGFVPIALAGIEVGAVQLGGTARIQMMGTFVAFCDYFILGEEVFAAAAYLSGEPRRIATVAAQDVVKIVTIAIVIIGVIAMLAGYKFLNLLNM